jgi:hypothetical protein
MSCGKQAKDPGSSIGGLPMTEKPAKPAAKAVTPRRRKTKPQKPDQREISERAYFIHLEQGGSDEFENWLRAERELTAA